MELFKIRCTTCQSKLRVQDPAAVGEIVACPKCNSMVLIDPPVDWVPPKIVPGAESKRPIVAVTTDSSGTFSAGTTSKKEESAQAPEAASVQPSQKQKANTSPDQPVVSGLTDEGTAAGPVDDIHLSPTEQLSRKLTLLMIVPAVALFAFTIYWTIAALRIEKTTVATAEAPAEVEDVDPIEDRAGPVDVGEDAAVISSSGVSWIPPEAAYLVRVGPSVLRSSEIARVVIENNVNTLWEALVPLLQDIDSANLAIESLQCAGRIPGQWGNDSVFVIRLSSPAEDVARWFATGKPTDIKVAGEPCRVFESWQWSYPLARVGEQTLISGSPAMLETEELGAREVQVSPTLTNLLGDDLQALEANPAAFRFAANLSRKSEPKFNWLPDWVLEQSSVSHACEQLEAIPAGVDMKIAVAELPEVSFALLSADEDQATSLGQALQQVLDDLGNKWQTEIADLEEQGQAGRLPEGVVDQVRGVLSQGMAVLQTAATLEDGVMLKTTFTLPGSLDNVASSFLDSWEGRQRFRDLQYIEGDLDHQQTILKGLTSAAGAEGYWPLGAAGAVQLPADTRLSWIASMLPYLEGNDAYRGMFDQLNFFRSWNDPANLEVARTPLKLYTNPRLGASVTAAGFPTTNYVGVAGLGADAASLEPADPRAGMFNVRHRVLLKDVKDGLSQTIAIMGVTGRLGPWAAGGDATVRPLTAQPYRGGPDHFGSGMNGGMFVGMADGSVRFIADDVDLRVMEQLVTINGGAIDPQVAASALIPASQYLESDSQAEEATTVEVGMEPVELEQKEAIAYDPQEVEANDSADAILDTMLAAIDFDDATLDDFAEFMTQLTTVKIDFDHDAFSDAGIASNDTLSVHLQGASYRAILDAALKPLGLGFVIHQGGLLITTIPNRNSLQRVAVYSVADLCGDRTEAYERLSQEVQSMIEPESWSTVGGPSRLEIEESALIVEANEQVHRALATYLAKLRLARELANEEANRSEVALISRVTSAFDALQTPVDLTFDNPTALNEILSRLQTSSSVNLLVDTATLDAAGVTLDVETILQAAGATLGQALDRLCNSLDLTFLIQDANTILVTTPTAAASSLELEFYPVEALLNEDTSIELLMNDIRTRIAPQSWRKTGGPAAMAFDEAGKCLIMLQTQATQAQVELLLAEMLANQTQE